MRRLLEEGTARLRAFPGRVDAVVGYWDFPVSTALPLLRQGIGLPTTSLESVLKCEHKYWSRIIQAEVIPDHVPRFCAVNPFADDPGAGLTLPYPFRIKPVKSVLSHLGFLVRDVAGFGRCLERIRAGIGRYGAPFNIEYFWDEAEDRISLLEINTRISKSHAPLFRRVDGLYHQVMIDLALGRRPDFPRGQGRYACAAKFMLRRYSDAVVSRAPGPAAIRALEADEPGVEVQLHVRPGMRLSVLRDQDSYSYEVAALFIGAQSEAGLEHRYRDCLARLGLTFTAAPRRK